MWFYFTKKVQANLFGHFTVEVDLFCKFVDFLPILTLISVWNVADDGGVNSIHDNRVLLMSGSAVIGAEYEQEGAQHTALRGSPFEH